MLFCMFIWLYLGRRVELYKIPLKNIREAGLSFIFEIGFRGGITGCIRKEFLISIFEQ